MITKSIISILLNAPLVTAKVGTRIFPNIIKQESEFPAVYVSTDRMETIGCMVDEGERQGTVEIGAYADTYMEAHSIISAIRTVMDNYTGSSNNVAIAIFRGIEVTDQFDDVAKKHVKVIEYSAIAEIN